MQVQVTPPMHLEALLAFACAALFLLLVAALHFIKPKLAPSWHMISEYAIGRYGWLMRLAFYSLAASCILTVLAISPISPGQQGPVLLIFGAIGALGAGVFITSAVGQATEQITPASILHVVFSFILIPIFPLAATLTDLSLRGAATFASIGYWLPWLSFVVWVGFIGFMGSSWYFQRSGQALGPTTPVGYFQRFMVLTYAGWLMAISFVILTSRM
jgi:hypothetical protein